LEAAMQIQKKKVIVGPQDAVGIMLFNTVRVLRSFIGIDLLSLLVIHRHVKTNAKKEEGRARR
jgi:hypothetical protein